MSLLCPQNYIPSNISSSMDEIEISLRNAPAQLQKLFRQKQSCDVVLKFDRQQYLAHRYVLEKTSTLFSKGLIARCGDKWIVEINVKAKKQLFTKILSCMYGHSTTIRRYQIQQAYQISKALQVPQLLKQFYNDMLTHFDQYDIFPLLKLATKEQLTQVSDLCYDQLEIEMYEPMRYNKSGLFLCQQELFKSIIKRHNYQKSANQKFGISYGQIRTIIDEYCFVNGLSDQKKEKLIQEIQDKQNLRYYVSLNQVLRKPSTPRKTKSASQIFFRNTLTLPRQKEQENNSSYLVIRNRKSSPWNNSCNNNNDSFECNQETGSNNPLLSPPYVCKSAKSQNSGSFSNNSTDNKSQQNRSRKESVGSVQTISDPKILTTIAQISQSQRSLKQSQSSMKSKAQEMLKKLKIDLEGSKRKASRIHKMQSYLEEIQAQINCSEQKLIELQKSVDNYEVRKNKQQAKQKFDQLFDSNIALDLTVSTEFRTNARAKV